MLLHEIPNNSHGRTFYFYLFLNFNKKILLFLFVQLLFLNVFEHHNISFKNKCLHSLVEKSHFFQHHTHNKPLEL